MIRPTTRRAAQVGIVVAMGAVVAFAFVAGRALDRDHEEVKLGAAPFVGRWDLRINARSLVALVIGLVVAVALPSLAARARLRTTVLAAAFAALVFGWSLAIVDGWSAIIAPVIDPTEYLVGVEPARPFWRYLRTYIERSPYYSVHVRGHPPGMMLVLLIMRASHLRTAWAAAAVMLLGVVIAVIAVTTLVWCVAGAYAARIAACLLALTPFAVWQVTSADSLFAGIAMTGLALLALALRLDRGTADARSRLGAVLALASGFVLAMSLYFTYGAATLWPIVLVIVVTERRHLRRRHVVAVLAGATVVVTGFAAAGFWWLDGFRSTQGHYWAGTAKFRPMTYFMVSNLAVTMFALGIPVLWAGLRRLGRGPSNAPIGARRTDKLALSGLVALLVANASRFSKGEIERIWLLFFPIISLVGVGALWGTHEASAAQRSASNPAADNEATAAVETDPIQTSRVRTWMAIQAATAIIIQASLVSKW